MLVKAIRHLVEAEPHVLEADLLGDGKQWHGRERAMDTAHDARQNRPVAHAGVEDAQARRLGVNVRHLVRRPARYCRLLVARVDECEVLLPVVVEAKWR